MTTTSDMIERPPFVSIVIPTLNEEENIAEVISSLRPQGDEVLYEILVVDGGSSDRTCTIVNEVAERDSRVKLLHNPARIQAAAVNLAACHVDPASRYILRADAHCSYPENFLVRLLSALKEHQATSVVVPMITTGKGTPFADAVAMAQNSRLGNGGAAHRMTGSASGFVDHGHHALFDRAFFLENSGYDETFAVNEDGEFDIRAAANGARVWMASDCVIEYHPRKTPLSLAKQYFRYGEGRCNTLFKHKVFPKIRQLVPVGVTLAVLGGFFISLLDGRFLLAPLAYLALCVAYAWRLGRGDKTLAGRIAAAFCVMHISWGTGFLTRTARHLWVQYRKRSSPPHFSST